jgi:pyruvate dehydrogenase E1 component alpha subunit
LIEVKFTRYFGHFEGDQQLYRGEEVAHARERLDCLKRFRARVTEQGLLTDEQFDDIDSAVAREIDEAVVEAKAAPKPGPDDLLTDVYVSY